MGVTEYQVWAFWEVSGRSYKSGQKVIGVFYLWLLQIVIHCTEVFRIVVNSVVQQLMEIQTAFTTCTWKTQTKPLVLLKWNISFKCRCLLNLKAFVETFWWYYFPYQKFWCDAMSIVQHNLNEGVGHVVLYTHIVEWGENQMWKEETRFLSSQQKTWDSPLFWSLWPLLLSLVAHCHMKRDFPTNCSLVTDYWQHTQLYHHQSLMFLIGRHDEDQAPPDHPHCLLTDSNSWTQHGHLCEHHLSVKKKINPYNNVPNKRMGKKRKYYLYISS